MQGDEPEAPKKHSKKDRKGKKNKKKKDKGKKGNKKESRKKRKEADALEEGFLEVSTSIPEYLALEVKRGTPSSVTEHPTAAAETPAVINDQMDLIPEMPTHEPDSNHEEPILLPTSLSEEPTVARTALLQSPQTEVEVDCKLSCPPALPNPSSSTPADLLNAS